MTLKDLKVGESCEVVKIESCGHLRRRLYDMGITPSCQIVLKKLAPLGDPMQISLRGYELTIRGEDAQTIVVNKLEKKEEESLKTRQAPKCSGNCFRCRRKCK